MIPASVISINSSTFENCDELSNISVSISNTYFCSEAGVLYNKTKTTLVKYPQGKIGVLR
ncbi:hypothetical protein MASR1M31_22350 [Porphyromonadaceae bacterium]